MRLLKWLIEIFDTERVRFVLWGVGIVGFYVFYTGKLMVRNDPSFMPIAGGFATILTYFLFTRKKSQLDDEIRTIQLDMFDMMTRNAIDSERFHSNNLKNELAKRDYELGMLRHIVTNVKNDVQAMMAYGPDGTKGMQLMGKSSLSRAANSKPLRPSTQQLLRISQDHYLDAVRNWKKAIRHYKRWSSRYSFMEGLFIIYSVILSTLGPDMLRIWHSQPDGWWHSLAF